MIADQNFYDTCFKIFVSYRFGYDRRPKFFRAEHSATAEGENWAYGPTLQSQDTTTKNYNVDNLIFML